MVYRLTNGNYPTLANCHIYIIPHPYEFYSSRLGSSGEMVKKKHSWTYGYIQKHPRLLKVSVLQVTDPTICDYDWPSDDHWVSSYRNSMSNIGASFWDLLLEYS